MERDNTVKLEVDMEPLKIAFDNVSLGFKEQGRSIRRLQIALALTTTATIINSIESLFF